jgi:hypothetical protein
MRLSEAYASSSLDDIKAALAGGTLTLYSIGRPPTADHPITRSSPLAVFTFASPAFGPDEGEGVLKPLFTEPAVATHVGTPGFARVAAADGAVVADFSVGPGAFEVKVTETSATPGFPISVSAIKVGPIETPAWEKTEFGHVYMTNADDPYRKLSVRG